MGLELEEEGGLEVLLSHLACSDDVTNGLSRDRIYIMDNMSYQLSAI